MWDAACVTCCGGVNVIRSVTTPNRMLTLQIRSFHAENPPLAGRPTFLANTEKGAIIPAFGKSTRSQSTEPRRENANDNNMLVLQPTSVTNRTIFNLQHQISHPNNHRMALPLVKSSMDVQTKRTNPMYTHWWSYPRRRLGSYESRAGLATVAAWPVSGMTRHTDIIWTMTKKRTQGLTINNTTRPMYKKDTNLFFRLHGL